MLVQLIAYIVTYLASGWSDSRAMWQVMIPERNDRKGEGKADRPE
jgi:hypothetical protein